MKKLLTIILILALAVPAAAFADLPDISNLSYDDLVKLKDSINLAMWNSQEWQEVTVPIGVWVVGEDIPIAHWSISIDPNSSRKWVSVTYCDLLNEAGTDAGNQFYCKIYSYQTIGSADNENYPQTIDLDLKPNTYIIIEKGSVVFTPYSGKPSLGFR